MKPYGCDCGGNSCTCGPSELDESEDVKAFNTEANQRDEEAETAALVVARALAPLCDVHLAQRVADRLAFIADQSRKWSDVPAYRTASEAILKAAGEIQAAQQEAQKQQTALFNEERVA